MRDKLLRPVVQPLLALLLVAAVPLTVLLFGLKTVVYSDTIYREIPESEEFVKGVRPFVEDSLEAECLFYDIPFDTLRTCVTDEWLREISREYTASVYEALCSGEELVPVSVSADVYRTALEGYFASLPEDKRPRDETVTDTLSKEFAEVTSATLSSGIINRVLNYGHDFVYGNTLLRRVSSYAPWALLATLVLAALSLLPWGGFRSRFYSTAGSLFVGSALSFVPLWLLKRYDLPSRLALGDSPLKLYVRGIVGGMTEGFTALTFGVFLAASVLLVAATVVLVTAKKEQHQ